jgi:hypothetical protein
MFVNSAHQALSDRHCLGRSAAQSSSPGRAAAWVPEITRGGADHQMVSYHAAYVVRPLALAVTQSQPTNLFDVHLAIFIAFAVGLMAVLLVLAGCRGRARRPP